MKRLYWQMTKKEIVKVKKPLEEMKERYAIEVREFIERLPCRFHKLAFYLACDPSLEVSMELTKMDRDEFGREEVSDPRRNNRNIR